MTVLAEQAFTPVRELENGKLFYSSLGIFPFQGEGLGDCYALTDADGPGGAIAVWDTGIGKTVLGLLAAAYMFEDDLIDQVMVVCEKNKVDDWQQAFERFTALSVLRYHGQGRQRRLERHGVPHVLVTTYETGRDELMALKRRPGVTRGPGSAVDGPLVETLGLRGKRVLWVFDEPIKLKSRSSGIYKAYWYLLGQLRKGPHHQRAIGLTATPMDTDYEQAFNIVRMMAPDTQLSVGEFEKMCTNGRRQYGPGRTGSYLWNGREEEWAEKYFQPLIIRKRKTDPDVVDQFPELIEESLKLPMVARHAEFYTAVETMLDPPEGEPDTRSDDRIVADERRLGTLLKITAGHPAAHLHLDNELSRRIVEVITEEGLRAIPSSKTARLIEELTPLIKGQGAQVILFEYYTSVITEVACELRAAGFTVGEYHGDIGDGARRKNLAAFQNGELEILFMSDAGQRGLNLQNAQYVYEYSTATTYSGRVQRGNRNNRIDSKLPSTTLVTMVLVGTAEERIFARTIDRNAALDSLIGDEADGSGFVSADERREILAAYHERRGGRARKGPR